jgi:flagellar biosynthesis/type III secretory pathway protein FliH
MEVDPRATEDFKKGYEAAKEEYLNVIDNENNLKAFVKGYKQGYKDGITAANKALQKQIENMAGDQDGVQPITWPRWP